MTNVGQWIGWISVSLAMGAIARVVRLHFLRHQHRSVVTEVVQGIIAGGVLTFLTTILVIGAENHAIQTTVDGWTTTLKCGQRRNGILLRAACASDVAALNLREE
jgi:hypothetical protein